MKLTKLSIRDPNPTAIVLQNELNTTKNNRTVVSANNMNANNIRRKTPK